MDANLFLIEWLISTSGKHTHWSVDPLSPIPIIISCNVSHLIGFSLKLSDNYFFFCFFKNSMILIIQFELESLNVKLINNNKCFSFVSHLSYAIFFNLRYFVIKVIMITYPICSCESLLFTFHNSQYNLIRLHLWNIRKMCFQILVFCSLFSYLIFIKNCHHDTNDRRKRNKLN